jgi:CRISPR-associated protein Cas1
MTTLYIDRKNVRLDLDAEALVFHENQERIGTIPLAPLQRIILRGNVSVDTSLLAKLGAHGIGIIILSGRKAEPSLFLPRPHNDASRRIAQYRAATDPDTCLRIARHVMRGKLKAQIAWLQAKQDSRLDIRYELTRVLRGLTGMLDQVETKPTAPELRGLEGAAANLYFTAYAALAPASVKFHGRNRRPPRDPLNAVLSLAYTLLHAEATLGAHAAGLDPWIGFYHVPAFGRESLASDLVEPLRADVDAWAIGLFNRQELRAEDFSTNSDGCFLGKAGRERFYRAWEPLAENLRRKLEELTREITGMIEPRPRQDDNGDTPPPTPARTDAEPEAQSHAPDAPWPTT